MKIYLDECLSPDFTNELCELDLHAECAQDLGHCGKPDDFLLDFAISKDYFLITRNGKDFIELAKGKKHHGILSVQGDMQIWEYRDLSVQLATFLSKHHAQLSNSIFYFTCKTKNEPPRRQWYIHK